VHGWYQPAWIGYAITMKISHGAFHQH